MRDRGYLMRYLCELAIGFALAGAVAGSVLLAGLGMYALARLAVEELGRDNALLLGLLAMALIFTFIRIQQQRS